MTPSDEDDEIETEFTDDPVCPKCAHKVADAFELSDDTEIECTGGCGAVFAVTRHVEVSYTTTLVKP